MSVSIFNLKKGEKPGDGSIQNCGLAKALHDELTQQAVRLAAVARPKIVVKPNFVLHEPMRLRGSGCLITQSWLVDLIVRSVWDVFNRRCEITVADVPLQSCDWATMIKEAGYDVVEAGWRKDGIDCRIMDFRREMKVVKHGYFHDQTVALAGDPEGCVSVNLGKRSFLEPLGESAGKFAVTDYADSSTRSKHGVGDHAYLISRSVLGCDLFINVPKLKTHQKAGITVGLKNLIGINADKSFLPHHRSGCPKFGGDEFRDQLWLLGYLHTSARRILQGKRKFLFLITHFLWTRFRSILGISQNKTVQGASKERLFVTDGAWYGNDTVWRTVLDINQLLFYANSEGKLGSKKRSGYLCVVDGVVAGEGNGPLIPDPKEAGVVLIGRNPVEVDRVAAQLMGFDPERIPLLRKSNYVGTLLQESSDITEEVFLYDEHSKLYAHGGLEVVPNMRFKAAPGWVGHIER